MSQIIGKEMKGSYRRNHGVDWPDNDPQVEKEEDHIGPDGTDYVAKAQSDFEEGEESEGSRVADMLRRIKDKRGAAGMKAEEAEREEKDEEGEDEDKEEKRELMDKSFFNYVEDNAVLMEGVNQSAFLQEMVKSIGFSFAKLEDNLGYVFANVHNDYVDFAKSVDGTFEELGKSLGVVEATGGAVDQYQSHGSVDAGGAAPLQKGGFDEGNLSKGDILNVLMKGFEAGTVSPQDIIKFETTGGISPNVQKSLGL